MWKAAGHSFDPEHTYGYRICKTREDLVSAMRRTYARLPAMVKKGLCAAVWTQLADVEEETNGLVTFDRAVMKLRPEELTDLAEELQNAVK